MQCQIHNCNDTATKLFARADKKRAVTGLYARLVCSRHLEALMHNVDEAHTDVIIRSLND